MLKHTRLIAFTAVLSIPMGVNALVIRHDTPIDDHRALADRYPMTAIFAGGDGTGTLIAPNWVVTAAHVAEGMAGRGVSKVAINGNEYALEAWYLHPLWQPVNEYDLALVKLKQAVDDTPWAKIGANNPKPDSPVVFAGAGDFGRGDTGATTPPGELYAATNSLDRVTATSLYMDLDLPESATALEGVPAGGDSGGPVFIDGPEPVLIGVASVGLGGPNGEGRYGVGDRSVNLSAHQDWIAQVMEGRVVEGTRVLAASEKRSATRRSNGQAVAVSVPVATGPFQFPDTGSGAMAQAFFALLENTHSEEPKAAIQPFYEQFTTSALKDRTPLDAFSRLPAQLQQEFGDLSPRGIIQNTDTALHIEVAGSNGAMGVIEFALSPDGAGLMDALMVARLD